MTNILTPLASKRSWEKILTVCWNVDYNYENLWLFKVTQPIEHAYKIIKLWQASLTGSRRKLIASNILSDGH